MKLFKQPIGWRVTLIVASIVFLVYGVIGVSSSQAIGATHAGVKIPNGWYWFAVVPNVLVAGLAIILPTRLFYDRRSLIMSALMFLAILAGSTGPLLYVIYDFEHQLQQSERSVRSEILPPNHVLQRTRRERRGCNRTPSWAGSLSLGR